MVLIDYQNIHLTAHELFAPKGTPKHETLVHPLHFANQVMTSRSMRIMATAGSGQQVPPQAQVAAVQVFRGRPSNRHNPKSYARSLAQASEWTRDRRVTVVPRTLQYIWNPDRAAYEVHEKGIDVLLAIALVREARERNYDVIVLATHDTDLEPAIEEASRLGHANIELAGWRGAKVLRPRCPVWSTYLDDLAFGRSQDRKDYT